jgi:hypothetical protein
MTVCNAVRPHQALGYLAPQQVGRVVRGALICGSFLWLFGMATPLGLHQVFEPGHVRDPFEDAGSQTGECGHEDE